MLTAGELLNGKYRIQRLLGVGGMAEVYLAQHEELGHLVAVKVMAERTSRDREQVDRFLREARVCARLQSDHTARVHDVGRLESGAPYLVMEFLRGSDLSAVLATEGPFSVPSAVDFVLQAMESVAEAHARGIIHRDLKLSNLFLTKRRDGRPHVKVLDFGLAKMTQASNIQASDGIVTESVAIFGTPHYMSPEQMRSASDSDARSDVWALGVCLYEMLVGRLPFEGEGIPAIFAAVMRDEPKPPRDIRPDLTESMESLLLRCLAKSPEDRFQSVGDLAKALEPFAGENAGASKRIEQLLAETGQAGSVPPPPPSTGPTLLAPIGKPERPTESTWNAAARGSSKAGWIRAALPLAAALAIVFGVVLLVQRQSHLAAGPKTPDELMTADTAAQAPASGKVVESVASPDTAQGAPVGAADGGPHAAEDSTEAHALQTQKRKPATAPRSDPSKGSRKPLHAAGETGQGVPSTPTPPTSAGQGRMQLHPDQY